MAKYILAGWLATLHHIAMHSIPNISLIECCCNFKPGHEPHPVKPKIQQTTPSARRNCRLRHDTPLSTTVVRCSWPLRRDAEAVAVGHLRNKLPLSVCGCWQRCRLALKCPRRELRIHGERLFTTILIDDGPVTILHLLLREPEQHQAGASILMFPLNQIDQPEASFFGGFPRLRNRQKSAELQHHQSTKELKFFLHHTISSCHIQGGPPGRGRFGKF